MRKAKYSLKHYEEDQSEHVLRMCVVCHLKAALVKYTTYSFPLFGIIKQHQCRNIG